MLSETLTGYTQSTSADRREDGTGQNQTEDAQNRLLKRRVFHRRIRKCVQTYASISIVLAGPVQSTTIIRPDWPRVIKRALHSF